MVCAKSMRIVLKLVGEATVETIDGTCGAAECVEVLTKHAADETAKSSIAGLVALFDSSVQDRKLQAYKTALKAASETAADYFTSLREKSFAARYTTTLDTAVVVATKTNEMTTAVTTAAAAKEAKLAEELAKKTPKVGTLVG